MQERLLSNHKMDGDDVVNAKDARNVEGRDGVTSSYVTTHLR